MTINAGKLIFMLFVSVAFVVRLSEGNPSSWFSTIISRLNDNDVLSTEDAQKIMTRLDELQAEIDSLKALLRGKVISSENDDRHVFKNTDDKNDENKVSFSSHSAPKAVAYPTGCKDFIFDVSDAPGQRQILKGISGIYLLSTGINTDKIQTVFCDFADINQPTETRLGYVDLKTVDSTHFTVLKNQAFNLQNAALTFDLELLNEGGHMNLATGVFTAPVSGFYHFSFSGIKDTTAETVLIYLRKNGYPIARSLAGSGSNSALTLELTLLLSRNDKVDLFKEGAGVLFDSPTAQYTSFTGFLIEEIIIFP